MFKSWTHRIFSAEATEPDPVALLEFANSCGAAVSGRFRGDELGWFALELVSPTALEFEVNRFMADQEGIRAELNSWAASLEPLEGLPEIPALMARVATAAQVFTVEQPVRPTNLESDFEACEKLCKYLAAATDGIYQIDYHGIYAADGKLLYSLEE